MRNRLYIALLPAALGAGSIALALPNARQNPPAQPALPRVMLRAATANMGTKPEVRVRWTITNGWLAPGGYNLYRIEGANRTKLNATPIKYVPPAGARALSLPGGGQIDVVKLMTLANTTTRDFRSVNQPLFGPKRPRPTTSAPVFRDLATGIRQLRSLPGPALSKRAIQAELTERPQVKLFLTKIKPPVPPPPPPPPTPTELSQDAKQDLVMGSMLSKDVNKTIGCGFDDTTATAGTAYQYALREIDAAGVEAAMDVATTQITVGADPQPAPPAGLEAAQMDQDSVDLRWTRLTVVQEEPFGIASYNVTRVDPRNPAGLKANKLPIVIADIPGNNGEHVEPRAFFTDEGVPIGKATYRVTMTDMFGRESAPATLEFTMEDWFTPTPPPSITAELRNNDVVVSWITHSDAAIRYRVYRVDTEDPAEKPQLITPEPIPGTPVGQPTPRQAQAIQASNVQHQAAKARSLQTRGFMDQFKINTDKILAQQQAISAAVAAAAKPPNWVTFTDPNVPKDHYYRYIVTAVFTRNNRDSAESPSGAVPVPTQDKLPAPTNPKSTFAARATRALDNSLAGAATRETAGSRSLASQKVGFFKLDMKTMAPIAVATPVAGAGQSTGVNLFKGIDENVGGTLTFTWDPVSGKAPVKYKIYRANATGYFETATPPGTVRELPTPATPRGIEDRSLAGLQKQFLGKPGMAFAVRRKAAEMQLAATTMKYIDQVAAPPAPLWNLVGESDKPTFNETTPRSHANYYKYRIVPISRWGVEGVPAEFAVRVPATLSPSIPSVLAAFPGDQGQVVLQMRANLDEEEVTRYRVYRKKIDAPIVQTPVAPPVTAPPPPAAPGAPVVVRPRPGVLQGLRFRGLGGPAPQLTHAEPKIGSRSLVASGPVAKRLGTGSARFGLIMKESVFSGIATAVSGPAAGAAAPPPDPAMQALLDLNSYEEVGMALGNTKDATGMLVFEDKNVTPQQDYVYRVVAENSDTLRSAASTITDAKPYKVAADPPVSLALTKQAGGVKLTWAPGPGGAIGYMVMRKSTPTSPAIQLGGLRKETSYTDFSIFPRVSYIYQVIAVDSSSNVSPPAEVTLTP